MKKRISHAAPLDGPSMADLMAEAGSNVSSLRQDFHPGERVRGTVVAVGPEYLNIDLHSKLEGFVNKLDLDLDKPFPGIGDELDLLVVEMKEGAVHLTAKISSAGSVAEQSIRTAFETKMPVEGTFEKEVNGGFEVTVCGERAFCPFSQVDLYRDPTRNNAALIGTRTTFLVVEFNPEERAFVISRRAILERERDERKAALREEMHEGDLRFGTVTRLMPFGAFVDLGGVEGLIPLKELSWSRDVKPQDILSTGDKVQVAVLSADWENERFTLSLKSMQQDPWIAYTEDFGEGQYVTGTVSRLMPFGAFVRLAPGVEGLLPIGRLGNGRRISHPREVLSEGQPVDVKIESVDLEARRISLSVVDARVQALKPGELAVGLRLTGIVEGARPFGVFVRLSEEKTGLLHISQCDIERGGDPVKKLETKFPPSSEVEVVITELSDDRIGLALASKVQAEAVASAAAEAEEASLKSFFKNQSNDSLGSLGALFGDIKL